MNNIRKLIENYASKKDGQDIDEPKKLLNKHHNFQNKIKVISIVGTNGKGSTSTYLAKQLIYNNKKVGLFISPALLSPNEMIKINGKNISDEKIIDYLEYFAKDFKRFKIRPFEIWTIIMAKYFYDEKVDIAVIEAGLGGRLDATKIFENHLLIGLTSISNDHIDVFGNSIENIIYEKINMRHNNKIKVFVANSNIKYKDIITKYDNVIFSNKYNKALNSVQKDNTGNVINILKHLNYKINYDIFNEYPLFGRFTILNNDPYLILDGAHNYDSIDKLITEIKQYKSIKNPMLIYASSENKNYIDILNNIENNFDLKNIYLCNFKHSRVWNLNNDKLKKYNKIDIEYIEDFIKENHNENIIFFGSLYFIAEIYKTIK